MSLKVPFLLEEDRASGQSAIPRRAPLPALGWTERTLFTLQWLSGPDLRQAA
jgi:hypothetical protein